MNTSDALILSLKLLKLSFWSISTLANADSTNASGQGSPYFFCNFFSNDPAFTPILIGIPCISAQFTTSITFCLDPIFPGFILKQSAPFSATFSAIL